MKVLVISGFLGVGKTTFIKELVKRTQQDIVILENEYGDTDIDRKELESTGDISVLDFVEGCVCCTMKEGFANSVMTIASTISPDYLVVEPTGAAELSKVKENLEKVTYGETAILPPITLVAPCSIEANLLQYGNIYKDQIKAADTIIFTKNENADNDETIKAENMVKEINPRATIIKEHYSGKDEKWWLALLGAENKKIKTVKESYDISKIQKALSENKSEDRDPFSFIKKPSEKKESQSVIEECSIKNPEANSTSDIILLMNDILKGRYGEIVRVKGVVNIGGENIRFDLADGIYCITGGEEYRGKPQCVFIGRNIDTKSLLSVLSKRKNALPIRIKSVT